MARAFVSRAVLGGAVLLAAAGMTAEVKAEVDLTQGEGGNQDIGRVPDHVTKAVVEFFAERLASPRSNQGVLR